MDSKQFNGYDSLWARLVTFVGICPECYSILSQHDSGSGCADPKCGRFDWRVLSAPTHGGSTPPTEYDHEMCRLASARRTGTLQEITAQERKCTELGKKYIQ